MKLEIDWQDAEREIREVDFFCISNASEYQGVVLMSWQEGDCDRPPNWFSQPKKLTMTWDEVSDE